MGAEPITESGRLGIEVSSDALQAWLQLPERSALAGEPPTEAEILAAVEAKGIELTDDVRARAAKCVELLTSALEKTADDAPELPAALLIAEGSPPVEGRDGELEWHEQFRQQDRDWQGEDSVNYYKLSSILTLAAGTAIGRITAPCDGAPGQDVYGRQLPPRKARGCALELGSGLHRSPQDASEIVTDVAGRVVTGNGQIWVEEVLAINGDVDFESGSIDVCTDVHVNGTVRANFTVRTTKSLTVRGAVEAADVAVGGDVVVHGGILGREQLGRVRAGGSVTARYCDEADLRAEGDVRICREIIHTQLRTNGRILAQAGAILASEVHAREGIDVQVLGNDVGVATLVSVGTHREILARARHLAEQIEKRTALATRIRARVEPLMTKYSGLTESQRTQVTELLDKAEELECSLEDLQRQREELLARGEPRGEPCVQVSKRVYPGVRLAIGPRETAIREPLSGAQRIEQRRLRGAAEIVAINPLTGAVTVLPSAEIDLHSVSWSDD